MIVFVLSILLFYSLNFQVLEAFRPFYFSKEEEECIKQLDADKDRIEDLYLRSNTPENDTQYNHFIECVWKKLEFQTENGEIDYKKLKNSPHVVRKAADDNTAVVLEAHRLVFDAVSKCESIHASLKANTTAETAVRVQNCIVGNFLKASESLR